MCNAACAESEAMIAMPAARPDQKSEPSGRSSSSSPCLTTAAWTTLALGGLRSSTSCDSSSLRCGSLSSAINGETAVSALRSAAQARGEIEEETDCEPGQADQLRAPVHVDHHVKQ